MQRRIWLARLLLLPFIAVVPLAAQQKAAPVDAAAVRAAIEQENARWVAAALRGDAAGAAAIFTDDAILLPPNSFPIVGRAAIQAAYTGLRSIRDVQVIPEELEVLGDVAIARGHYVTTHGAPGQPAVVDRAKFIDVWKRGADGVWRKHRDMFSSDLPASPAAAAPAGEVAAVRAAIERTNAEWAAASLRHDAAAIAAQYTEDAIFMGPGGPAGMGRAAIEKGVAEMPPIRDPRLTVTEVEVFGTTAIERGTFHMTIGARGQAVTDDGKYLIEWKQGSDGVWRRHREIFNSDVPAPPVRAAPGDSVLVVLNHVKPEQRAEWERMANEVWLAAWRKLGESDPPFRAAARDVRVLAPTAPDADGSYTYVVLADPHHPGMSYDARASLARLYPPEKVQELIQAWVATFARPQEAHFVVQQK